VRAEAPRVLMSPSLFVVGGARSGKSAFAQHRAEAYAAERGAELVFVATAEPHDDEMRERIARHRADRSARWRTVEATRDLAPVLAEQTAPDRIVLVDCLTLWLSNRLLEGDDLDAAAEVLASALRSVEGPLILVSNEVGLGIVPDNALARRFRDAQGRLNQAVAAICSEVVLVSVGLPLLLKSDAAFTALSGMR
jgi:adenosylcobinamide kinase / adenosylcobinamide-phosphate guanylyltransferase